MEGKTIDEILRENELKIQKQREHLSKLFHQEKYYNFDTKEFTYHKNGENCYEYNVPIKPSEKKSNHNSKTNIIKPIDAPKSVVNESSIFVHSFLLIIYQIINDISIIFEDDGIRYDPVASLEPDVTLPYEERDIGGLGIFMVKKIATKIDYKYENNKNILTTILNRKGE